ncbi:transporter [Edaphobacter bradus]|uniref:transporter n=1 Tax=Edaphobacter bradus TaxID=2259016 RepID=UPI0021DFEAEB|nr:transporter [Edaphobacter bradus]
MLSRTVFKSLLALQLTVVATAQTTTIAANNAAPPGQPQTRDIVDLKLQDALRERDAIIRNLLERVQELEWRVNGGFTTRPGELTAGGAAAEKLSHAVSSTAYSTVTNAGYDIEERQASEALDRALLVRGGLLLPQGTLEIDNTTSYYTASSDHLTVNGFALLPILVVGDITSQRVRKDILLPTFTARLGLPARLQAEVNIPYGYEMNRTVDATNKQTSQSTFGLGDIQFAASRQLTFEHGRVPDLLANLRFKTTTGVESFDIQSAQTSLGSGFYALQGNLTAAKSSDPVVFFGNLSYTENLPGTHTIPNPDATSSSPTILGHFRPGDAIGFQLGSILSLNPETSMTVGWDQRFTRSTVLNGTSIPASYLVEGSLRLGMTYLYAPGKLVDLSFGVGLTPDTPNLQFSVGLPFRLSLWKPPARTY